MLILRGGNDFFNKFDYKIEGLGSNLRAIFHSLSLNLEEESREVECLYPKLFIGTEDFKELLLESDYIVDKSLFIWDILTTNKKLAITRPRRWGKSLNLNMLRTFLEIEQDMDAFNEKRKLFEGGEYKISDAKSKILNELKIAKHKNSELYKENFGSCPVIFLKLSGINLVKFISETKSANGRADNDIIEDYYRENIKDSYCLHKKIYKKELEKLCIRYNLNITPKMLIQELENLLYASKHTLPNELILFRKYMESNKSVNLYESIKNLIKVLYDHYQKKVFIIIDDCDSQVIMFIGHPLFSEISSTCKRLLNQMKPNSLIEKVVIVGSLPLTLSILLRDLNTSFFSIESNYLSEHFGFTPKEVDDLLNKITKNNCRANKMQKEIALWYNGYKFENTINYNPWSIVKYIQSCLEGKNQPAKAYWASSSVLDTFKMVLFMSNNLDVIKELILKEKNTLSSLMKFLLYIKDWKWFSSFITTFRILDKVWRAKLL